MNRTTILLTVFAFCAVFVPASRAAAASILNSPHNLTAGSQARIKTEEQRVCVFCHTPHHSTILSDALYTGPLWSRDANLNQYQPYESSTILAKPGQPQGASRLCLSCHDGTIAIGATVAHGTPAQLGSLKTIYQTNPPPFPQKSSVIGNNLDLRGDHPVSMEYGQKADEFISPEIVTSTSRVKLVPRGSSLFVECTSCHDPHDDQYGNFLVVNTANQHDALCTTCHNKSGWNGSSHKTGGTRYPTVAGAVAADGCISCHTPHGAQQGENLLTLSAIGAGMDTNCYTSCHTAAGGAPYLDIWAQFNTAGLFTHPLSLDAGANRHTETEELPLTADKKHVHCVDCHNPHQAVWQNAPLDSANAPAVNGVIGGVRGVDIYANPTAGSAQYEYQICFRCHSGASALNGDFNDRLLQVARVFTSMDERERFDFVNAKSLHPVSHASTLASNGESLINKGMRSIYCNDCHNSHGTTLPHMLNNDNPDVFPASPAANYRLCYSCHFSDWLLIDDPDVNRRKLHNAHVLGAHNPSSGNSNRVPCSACHDPHGVPYKPGLTTSFNALHLINFDLRYVGSTSSYDANARSCNLVGPGTSGPGCHPKTVNPASYNPYSYP